MKYPAPKPGEWVSPKRRFYHMACCDCGLVHRMEFTLIDWARGKKILFRAWRDNKKTAARRKRHNIKVKTR